MSPQPMSPERWKQVESLYHAVLEQDPSVESTRRVTLVMTQVGNDPGGHGFLIFRRDEALVGYAFDPAALTLSGDVFTIAEDVNPTWDQVMMASVAANGVLVYGTGRNTNTQLTWLDRAGKVLSVAGPVRNYQGMALSPQGSQILIGRGGRNRELWVRDAARDSESRLGGGMGVWSPDGRVVAFPSHGNFLPQGCLGRRKRGTDPDRRRYPDIFVRLVA